jgi:hypothetical protein
MPATKRDTPQGRFYDIDGDAFPSVTHILGVIGKPALINWAANQERDLVTEAAADLYLDLLKAQPMSRPVYTMTLAGRLGTVRAHRRAMERAGAIGSQTHALIEWTLRHELGQTVPDRPEVDDPARWAFEAYRKWAEAVNLQPRLIEQTVWSRTHKYAGTMDLLADVDGVPTLVDFKTGKAIYPEAHLQNVAYQVALAEMGHATPAGGLIVRLPKVRTDPDFELATVRPVGDLLPVFLAVRQLWQWSFDNDAARAAKGAA